MNKAIHVLLVDDEYENLDLFKSEFKHQYIIFTAENPSIAQKILAQETIHVLIADQRMPLISGMNLLTQIRIQYPKVIRILTSACNSFEDIQQAINKSEIYRYIKKPWQKDDVIDAINCAYNLYQHSQSQDTFIEQVSNNIRGPITALEHIAMVLEKEKRHFNVDNVDEYVQLITRNLTQIRSILDIVIYLKQNIDYKEAYSSINFKQAIHKILLALSIETSSTVKVCQTIDFYAPKNLVINTLSNLLDHITKPYKTSDLTQLHLDIDINCSVQQASIFITIHNSVLSQHKIDDIFSAFHKIHTINKNNNFNLYVINNDKTINNSTCFKLTIRSDYSKFQ